MCGCVFLACKFVERRPIDRVSSIADNQYGCAVDSRATAAVPLFAMLDQSVRLQISAKIYAKNMGEYCEIICGFV